MKYTCVIIFLNIFIAINAIAGPFGTNMNDTPQKYGKEYDEGYNSGEKIIRTENLLKKHPLLKSYDLFFRDGKLFSVWAFSSNNQFEEDYKNFDDAIKDYNTIYEQLKNKYGNENYTNENFFGKKEDKTIKKLAGWSNKENQLPDNLESISIELLYYPLSKYTIRLIYNYENKIGWMPYNLTHPRNDGSDAL